MKISSFYSFARVAVIGAAALTLSACVVEPYPQPVAYAPPPPGPVAVAPGPYYAAPAPYYGPCCYAYPEYPAYANVGVSFGGGGWGGGGHRWR